MRISDWSSDVCSSDLIIKPLDDNLQRAVTFSGHLEREDLTDQRKKCGWAFVSLTGQIIDAASFIECGKDHFLDLLRHAFGNAFLSSFARIGQVCSAALHSTCSLLTSRHHSTLQIGRANV